ncbi:uncharacterized protein EI90DRAFT_1764750 [Cantharellus anzutake]|uniref:uncharacterized protein n=1 Tax=Cantharellus anzutake TaxID=1750568 RepID=UPI001904C9DB|nr:uncharacterized protein EI90DRAFT_1764750 [Cantharellus anzutake]KAF8327538.1 hypothetical protein EI90DRAFT_1764750 [Cantharellus anzutake]
MFFEEGHVFDDWRLTCHDDGYKYSIGLRDGRVLSGKRGVTTWDLRKVAEITDLQKWTFEKIRGPPKPINVASPINTSKTDQYTHRSTPASSITSAWTRHDPQDESDIKPPDLKRRQAQLHLERQHGAEAFELLQREYVRAISDSILNNGHQLGFANKLRDGAGAMVRPSSDWEVRFKNHLILLMHSIEFFHAHHHPPDDVVSSPSSSVTPSAGQSSQS